MCLITLFFAHFKKVMEPLKEKLYLHLKNKENTW